MQQPKIVKIISWNCRDLNSSLPCVEVLADDADIIVLSEHWLWPFDLHKFDGIHPNMKGTAVADSRLSPVSELSRGCGVVVLQWPGRSAFKLHLLVAIPQTEYVPLLLSRQRSHC